MERPSQARALTQLILEVFRLNGVLLETGDRMTSALGLTSARWQVLGAISIEKQKLTVSQIGKRMGLARQGVQRIVNDLEQLGFVSLHHNPDHKVAKLVGLTDLGTSAMTQIDQIQTSWASKIADGLTESSLNETVAMIRNIRLRCEATEDQQKREKRD